MVNLIKSGCTLIITSDQSFPFDKGKISVPMNSLYYIIDESDAIVFRSVANGDIIFNALLTDLQIDGTQATKDNIIQLFDSVANSVASGGGGSLGAVESVNGQTGIVNLTANDVNAYSRQEIDNVIATLSTQEWVNEQINAAIANVNVKINEINNKIV